MFCMYATRCSHSNYAYKNIQTIDESSAHDKGLAGFMKDWAEVEAAGNA